MATLQEVKDATEAFELAQNTANGAQSQLVVVEAAVLAAISAEQATFDAAVTLFNDQLQLARDAAGFHAALSAVVTANTELSNAESTLKTLMAEYASV
jgi:hypothetical protein